MTKLRLLCNFYIKQSERFEMKNQNRLEKKSEFYSLLEELKKDSISREKLLDELLALVDSSEKAESLVAVCKADEVAWVRRDLNQAW